MKLERRRTAAGEVRIRSVHAGTGPPVVLLHGLSGSHRWWRFTLPALATDRRVHVPALLSFGTPAAGWRPSIGGMAEVMVGWLDALGLERADLVGHSMGGQIAIHIAARWPDRIARLVLANAAGIPRDLSLTNLVMFLTELIPLRAWGRLTFLPTIAFDALRTGPRAVLRTARYILADDVRPLLPRIRSETLVIWGERDALTPLRHGRILADRIPDAQLVVLPGAAHNSMADRPAEFNRAVKTFLDIT